MCCSYTCQFSVIAALPLPFLFPPLPSSSPLLSLPFPPLPPPASLTSFTPPSFLSPFPSLPFPCTPLPLSFLWIASLLILIAYALPCLSYLPPPILSYLFLPYLEEKCETLPCG